MSTGEAVLAIIRASGTWALAVVLFLIGRDIKRRLLAIEDEMEKVRRVDEASQWGPGDVVTFGDGSRIVTASLAPGRHGEKK